MPSSLSKSEIRSPKSEIWAKGFTLIEALISITIMVLVTTLAIPNLRRFNDTQQLKSETEKLVSTLRLAQADAQNHIQPGSPFTSCPDTQFLNWQVAFYPSTTPASYQLGWICDYVGRSTKITSPIVTNVIGSGITMTLPSGCQNFVDYYQNLSYSNCFTNGTFNIQLTSSKTGTSRTITINQGGAISAQ